MSGVIIAAVDLGHAVDVGQYLSTGKSFLPAAKRWELILVTRPMHCIYDQRGGEVQY